MKGMTSAPAANHLYNTQQESPVLNQDQVELFHHITVQPLYLCIFVREQDLTFKWLRPSCTHECHQLLMNGIGKAEPMHQILKRE